MSSRFGAFVVIPAVFLAGALALYGVERVPGATAAPSHEMSASPAPAAEMLPSENGDTLPPGHPSIGADNGGTFPPTTRPSVARRLRRRDLYSRPPPIRPRSPGRCRRHGRRRRTRTRCDWRRTAPPVEWRSAVSRAGGETEANIARWIAQFDDVGHDGRAEKTVRGLHVVTVDVAGTYVGGGMAMGAPAQPRSDWAMVGSIVETRSPSYFFKMTGPAAAVRAARPVFDRFIDGITPV